MNLVPIGYLQKPHGTKGELKVTIEDAHWEDFQAGSVFFVKIQGQPLPYFKANVRLNNPVTIQFEDVNNREAAKKIASTELFMRQEDLSENLNETLVQHIYQAFLLVDKELGEIGVIEEVLELPQQEMAVVKYKGKEVMIPLNDTFVKGIDRSKKRIDVELPEGLLDL